MRALIACALFAFSLLGHAAFVRAQPAATEADLVLRLTEALKTGNRSGYLRLFPEAEVFAEAVLRHADTNSSVHAQMQRLLTDPDRLSEFDARVDSARLADFDSLRVQGDNLGVRWQEMRFARFELEKMRTSRDQLWEKVAPIRFLGYVFLQDPITGKNYCYTVGDVVQIGGKWYGGMLTRIFEASTKAEFETHLAAARKAERKGEVYIPAPPREASSDAEESEASESPRKIVLERKFYDGTFDGETRAQLYLRGLKGDCGGKGPCLWEAVFKFGDDEWQAMSVTRTEGKWLIAEDPGAGAMELSLEGKNFTGQWTSGTDGTGYEVKLAEALPSNKKMSTLEAAAAELLTE